jgi:hypothetical protein
MRLKNSPITDTGNIRLAFTIGGKKNLLVASPSKKIVIIQILESETIEPMTSALCHPKECLLSYFLYAILSAIIEIANPIKSEAKCAESVRIAIDPEKYPPINCATIKTNETNEAKYSCD